MSLVDLVQTYLSYNEALNRRMWESIMGLSEAQYAAEADYSRGSVRDQALHIIAAEGRWLRGVQGRTDARAFNPSADDYPTRAEAFALWQEHADEFRAYAEALDEAELERVPARMRGPVWQVLLHVANHSTDHRAQILRALHDFGAETFEQDLIYYMWSR
jgi:uncharacterized damage-inducible protein DinB